MSLRSTRATRPAASGAIPALPSGRIGRALQLGIPASGPTAELAARCGALLVVDDDERRVRSGRHRYRSLAHVRFDSCRGPHDLPVRPFSLIVCSGLFARWDRASAGAR